MGRKKKLVNNSDIPDHVIKIVAEYFLPFVQELYVTEEGQREFAQWQAQQQAANPKKSRKTTT